jgi:hypothetical protein
VVTLTLEFASYYVRHVPKIRLPDAHEYGVNAVRNSIRALIRRKKRSGRLGPITIYGEPDHPPVEISEQMIEAMDDDLDAPFR